MKHESLFRKLLAFDTETVLNGIILKKTLNDRNHYIQQAKELVQNHIIIVCGESTFVYFMGHPYPRNYITNTDTQF